MIEIPEALTLAEQINTTAAGKRITNVMAASSPHKFAWYYGDPQKYHELLSGKKITHANGLGFMVEIFAEDITSFWERVLRSAIIRNGTNVRRSISF